MTEERDIEATLDAVVESDPRFRQGAYLFVLAGLEFTRRRLKRKGHVSGRELLFGLRDYAMERFGLMAPTVFRAWGVKTTLDFGFIVENLIEAGVFSKRDEDSLESFRSVFDFEQEFVRRYRW